MSDDGNTNARRRQSSATFSTVTSMAEETTRRVRAVTTPTVELHVISDSTGETAARLVQELQEIRHPRVETVTDLQLAVERMRGRPAVVVYTLVEPELRETMRTLCRRAKLHYCDLLGHPIEAVAKVS